MDSLRCFRKIDTETVVERQVDELGEFGRDVQSQLKLFPYSPYRTKDCVSEYGYDSRIDWSQECEMTNSGVTPEVPFCQVIRLETLEVYESPKRQTPVIATTEPET